MDGTGFGVGADKSVSWAYFPPLSLSFKSPSLLIVLPATRQPFTASRACEQG